MMLMLAQSSLPGWLQPNGAQMFVFLGCVAVSLVIYLLWLSVKEKHDARYAPKPSYEERIEELRASLKGLAPSEAVSKLIEGLAAAATKTELTALASATTTLIEKEIAAHRTDMERQLKDQRAYVHEEIHALRNQFNAFTLSAETYREGVHGRLNAITEVLFELRGRMAHLTPD